MVALSVSISRDNLARTYRLAFLLHSNLKDFLYTWSQIARQGISNELER